MASPWVTVICLCHNQDRFVKEAILSVLDQDYANIQLIVIDDASSDDSKTVISQLLVDYPNVKFISLGENRGNCRAFNHGLSFAIGEYFIDLAADDILLPDRVSKGVMALTQAGNTCGINFSDAEWIAEDGSHLYWHSERFPHHTIPQGSIYKELIERFFICSPTMMFSRQVIETLKGYDEKLSYEDFDFWIRSSRYFNYCYTPEVLVRKRIVKQSMSARQFTRFSPQLKSTFLVCEKIFQLNRSRDEQQALAKRIRYEITVCLRLRHMTLALKYVELYLKNRARRYD